MTTRVVEVMHAMIASAVAAALVETATPLSGGAREGRHEQGKRVGPNIRTVNPLPSGEFRGGKGVHSSVHLAQENLGVGGLDVRGWSGHRIRKLRGWGFRCWGLVRTSQKKT